MSHRLCLSLILLCLASGSSAHSHPAPAAPAFSPAAPAVHAYASTPFAFPEPPRVEAKWVADEDDNICGIKDLKKVSNPAKVDYDDLWDATPQIKKMKEKKIDPESTEGKALRNQAKTLITKTCELVRSAKGHCGVWKTIKNADGRTVPNVTDDVKDKLDD
jgi:hypothetical protein